MWIKIRLKSDPSMERLLDDSSQTIVVGVGPCYMRSGGKGELNIYPVSDWELVHEERWEDATEKITVSKKGVYLLSDQVHVASIHGDENDGSFLPYRFVKRSLWDCLPTEIQGFVTQGVFFHPKESMKRRLQERFVLQVEQKVST